MFDGRIPVCYRTPLSGKKSQEWTTPEDARGPQPDAWQGASATNGRGTKPKEEI
jgi:hypothetical protein